MPLRILHVVSSNFVAGSTMYAIDLSIKQISEGHIVFLTTDTVVNSEMVSVIQLPVSDRSLIQRFRNIQFLKKFIREHNIDLIHAHSRAASWISFHAVKGSNVAFVSTIHGRQVKHNPLKRQDVFGDRIIAICPNLLTHLKEEIKLNSKKLELIPNGFDLGVFQKIKRSRQDEKVIISFIGRFNGMKGVSIAHVLTYVMPFLLHYYANLYIQLVGGEWDSFSPKGKTTFEKLKKEYGNRVTYLGFSKKVHELIVNSDLVVGAGRVAIKGLFHGIPVFALGEACCHGILTKSNINEAISTNFGDISPCLSNFKPDSKRILEDFRSFLDNPLAFQTNLSGYLKQFDLRYVYPKIMQVYRSALIQKAYHGNIPILMYHKIPDATIDSKHRIFVTKEKFERHLKFFRLRGLTTITFKDYFAFLNGDKSLRDFPKKPIILTFDDGYEDNYRNMLPLTKKYGFKGVLFLLGDFSIQGNNWDVGESPDANRLMTLMQKKQFVEAGWEIGAHTLSHCDLTKLSEERALHEIVMSKTLLEEKLQTNVISFAYPYGIYNDQIKKNVERSGMEFGISTDTGGIHIEDDRMAVFRINMFPEESLFQLYKKTSPWYRAYYFRKRNK